MSIDVIANTLRRELFALDADPCLVDLAVASIEATDTGPPVERSDLLRLLVYLLYEFSRGEVRVPLRPPAERRAVFPSLRSWRPGEDLRWLMAPEWAPICRAVPTAPETAAGPPGPQPMLSLHAGFVYITRWQRLVARIDETLRGRVGPVPRTGPPLTSADEQLSDEQRRAVGSLFGQRVAILTGGPGTGKTTVLHAYLNLLYESGVDPTRVALCAPTGKAAQRMAEAIRKRVDHAGDGAAQTWFRSMLESSAPRTIHRLLALGSNPSPLAAPPLDVDAVIADEASMIDLPLFAALLDRTPADARLLLVGDEEQLPPVGVGAPFRELVHAWRAPRVQALTQSFRMRSDDAGGRSILAVARAAQSAAPTELRAALTERPQADGLQFEGAEWLDATAHSGGWNAVDHFARRVLFAGDVPLRQSMPYRLDDDSDQETLRALFAHFAGARILCATRSMGPLSADAVNARLIATAAARRGDRPSAWPPGTPFVVEQNDYELELFNGDQGIIVRVEDGLMAVVERDGALRSLSLAPLSGRIRPGYATTIHKSQGSEFEQVLLLLGDRPLAVHEQALLYTGITRAKHGLTVVAPAAVLDGALVRRSRFGAGLAQSPSPDTDTRRAPAASASRTTGVQQTLFPFTEDAS